MLTIAKEFHFSASHQLFRLPEGHPCARMHGHNYIIEVQLCAHADELSPAGFVRDYRELDDFKKWIDSELDHRHLNDQMGDVSPSAENIAIWVYRRWCSPIPELTAVRVSETPKTWAQYRPALPGS